MLQLHRAAPFTFPAYQLRLRTLASRLRLAQNETKTTGRLFTSKTLGDSPSTPNFIEVKSASNGLLRHRTLASFANATSLHAEILVSSRLYSTFQPPAKNAYHGSPAYDDIDIEEGAISDAAVARNGDPEALFVVTGASRSMGLQFVKSLLLRTRGRIAACVLRPGSAPALDSFLGSLSRDERSRVEVHPLDVTDINQIEQLAKDLGDAHGRVDGLFNVAGSLGDKTTTPGPEMNLSQLDQVWAEQQMAVNAIGPLMITSRLGPLLKARKGRANYLRQSGARESVVVNISARVASMDDNTGGLSWYSYRMSKAALNQGVRTSSRELRRHGIWTLALYPGMTDTDMSSPFQTKAMKDKGLVFPVEFTVGRMLDVVDRMEEGHSGGFYDWAGQAIPF